MEAGEELLHLMAVKKPKVLAPAKAGLLQQELDRGFDELIAAGVFSVKERLLVEARFIQVRSHYFQDAFELCKKYHAIRAPWTGVRIYQEHVVYPDASA